MLAVYLLQAAAGAVTTVADGAMTLSKVRDMLLQHTKHRARQLQTHHELQQMLL
jgi:hypothetical protein